MFNDYKNLAEREASFIFLIINQQFQGNPLQKEKFKLI